MSTKRARSGRNRTQQINIVDDLAVEVGAHQLKIGGDYRAIFLNKRSYQHGLGLDSFSVQGSLSAGSIDLFICCHAGSSALSPNRCRSMVKTLGTFGPRFTLTYGLRWELAPAPSARGTTKLASWTNVNDPAAIALSPFGTPLWSTTYGNFAPRVGMAYRASKKGDLVVRAGWGVFYDLGVGRAADAATFFPGTARATFPGVALPLTNVDQYLPVISLQPPFPSPVERILTRFEPSTLLSMECRCRKVIGRTASDNRHICGSGGQRSA